MSTSIKKYNACTRQPEKTYTYSMLLSFSAETNISLLHARAFQVGKHVHKYQPETFQEDHNLNTCCPGYNYQIGKDHCIMQKRLAPLYLVHPRRRRKLLEYVERMCLGL